LAALQNQLGGGLALHLLSIPIGLRVYDWLHNGYPELRELQAAQVGRELALNRSTMSPKMRDTLPEKIYKNSQAINAAFAMFWAEKYNQPDLKAAYRFDFQNDGQDLLKIWRDVPQDPVYDRELIDRWAERLRLTGWYDWVPYDEPA